MKEHRGFLSVTIELTKFLERAIEDRLTQEHQWRTVFASAAASKRDTMQVEAKRKEKQI